MPTSSSAWPRSDVASRKEHALIGNSPRPHVWYMQCYSHNIYLCVHVFIHQRSKLNVMYEYPIVAILGSVHLYTTEGVVANF